MLSPRAPRGSDPGARSRLEGPRPATILLAPASNVLFHVGRCVMLARELAHRGHRTLLAGTDRYLRDPEVVTTAESTYVPLPDFTPEQGMELLRSIRMQPDRRQIETFIEAEIALLEEVRPDLVVADFRPTMMISARACGIPVASLLLSHWMPAYARDPGWVPRTYALGVLARRMLGERLAVRVAAPIFRQVIRYKTATFRAAARARGQKAPDLLWDLIQGELNLLTDSERLSPHPLPRGSHRVGPILWEPKMPLPDWVDDLDPDRPVVFVNYGSTAHPDLFRTTFEELADRPYNVILATCGQIDAESFRVPPNFFVEKFLPVSSIVEMSDIVVYHGGAGTFHQAIRAGVPGVVVATHWDQEHAGQMSERLGLGTYLTMSQVLASSGLLDCAVSALIDDVAVRRERMEPLTEDLRSYDGPKLATDRLEAFLDRRRQGAVEDPGRAG